MNHIDIPFFDTVSTEIIKNNSGMINLVINKNDKNKIIKRLNLFSLDFIEIKIKFKKINKTDIKTTYNLSVKGKQKCVVTLKPLNFHINKKFNMTFIDNNKLDIKNLEDEYVEPVFSKNINFGDVSIQMFSLFLDPYPRLNNKNILSDKLEVYTDNNYSNKNNPFQVLNKIKK